MRVNTGPVASPEVVLEHGPPGGGIRGDYGLDLIVG